MSEAFDSSNLDQARLIHRTLRQLQQRVLVRKSRPTIRASRAPKDLSHPQLTTLSAIRELGQPSLKDLAEVTGVSAPSASAMVDKLVELGYAERRPNDSDRREIRISVTPIGDRAALAFETESLQTLVDLMDRIGPDTARKWGEVYAKIQDCLDREKRSELVVK